MRAALQLGFKGSRDYVQGPDIYSAIVNSLELDRDAPFRVIIHHFARRQCELVVGAPDSTPPANPVALFWTTKAGVAVHGWVEESNLGISQRVSYEEESIWSRCQRSGNEIRMTSAAPANYAAIEVLVSLTKRLHLDALDEGKVKWVFTQLDVSRLLAPGDPERFRVRIDQAQGQRFTKSSIFSGSERLGSIHFAGLGVS